MKNPTRGELLLSLQRALLGEVSPFLRAAGARSLSNGWRIVFVYDGEIRPTDHDSATAAVAEVLADYGDEVISDEIVRVDAPELLPGMEAWAYRRREPA
jgi:hypothetical protein